MQTQASLQVTLEGWVRGKSGSRSPNFQPPQLLVKTYRVGDQACLPSQGTKERRCQAIARPRLDGLCQA